MAPTAVACGSPAKRIVGGVSGVMSIGSSITPWREASPSVTSSVRLASRPPASSVDVSVISPEPVIGVSVAVIASGSLSRMVKRLPVGNMAPAGVPDPPGMWRPLAMYVAADRYRPEGSPIRRCARGWSAPIAVARKPGQCDRCAEARRQRTQPPAPEEPVRGAPNGRAIRCVARATQRLGV